MYRTYCALSTYNILLRARLKNGWLLLLTCTGHSVLSGLTVFFFEHDSSCFENGWLLLLTCTGNTVLSEVIVFFFEHGSSCFENGWLLLSTCTGHTVLSGLTVFFFEHGSGCFENGWLLLLTGHTVLSGLTVFFFEHGAPLSVLVVVEWMLIWAISLDAEKQLFRLLSSNVVLFVCACESCFWWSVEGKAV